LRLRFHDDFKTDYKKYKKQVSDGRKLDTDLKTFTDYVLKKRELPASYTTNRLVTEGTGWYECFIYTDKKHTLILLFKLESASLTLARLGPPAYLTTKSRRK